VPVAVHRSVEKLYRPPVFSAAPLPGPWPPQTIISVPVQTATGMPRADGTFAPVPVGVHVSVAGSYRPPVFVSLPPQTISSLPVQTAA
jgi:hypothetical protein